MGSSHSAMLKYVLQKSRPGDIRNVIETIDEFAWNKRWLMNIGDRKGEILDSAVRTRSPSTILELGTSFSDETQLVHLLSLANEFS
jgi:catechol O-methyltransferase